MSGGRKSPAWVSKLTHHGQRMFTYHFLLWHPTARVPHSQSCSTIVFRPHQPSVYVQEWIITHDDIHCKPFLPAFSRFIGMDLS